MLKLSLKIKEGESRSCFEIDTETFCGAVGAGTAPKVRTDHRVATPCLDSQTKPRNIKLVVTPGPRSAHAAKGVDYSFDYHHP